MTKLETKIKTSNLFLKLIKMINELDRHFEHLFWNVGIHQVHVKLHPELKKIVQEELGHFVILALRRNERISIN